MFISVDITVVQVNGLTVETYNNLHNINMKIQIPQDEWNELIKRISNLEEVLKCNERKTSDELLTSKDVVRILGISDKTWQTYRSKGIIPFSQIGRKIYVRKEDLERYICEHRISERREI